MEASIREFIEATFRPRVHGQPFDDETPLFSSGIVDSFGVLQLIAFLEEAFHVDIDTSRRELTEFDTVRKIAGLVAGLPKAS